MSKEDLALNNLQWLICHKTQLNKTKLGAILRTYQVRWLRERERERERGGERIHALMKISNGLVIYGVRTKNLF